MSEQNSHFYEFGPFRLDPVKRLLFRGDETVKLAPKSFETLLALVEHHGRVLEKEELMKLLWPDSFVEEGNLTLNVSNLRKALGENPQQHEYIVTVPGKGYRFVASVKESAGVREESGVSQRTRAPLINGKEAAADAHEETLPRLIAPPAASRLTRPLLLA